MRIWLWGEYMKLDHIVINIDEIYQKDKGIINEIRSKGFPYEPNWGKGTSGFKASNLWIGNEYFEMIRILKLTGGGWVPEWTRKYNEGHRGMICLMLDVDDIDTTYCYLHSKGLLVTHPKWLEFKWFFNLFTRRMPWRNCYIPFFDGVPFQIGFQEMKDEKSRTFMRQYMVPNSRDNEINGINKIIIKGQFTENDFYMISTIFCNRAFRDELSLKVQLTLNQSIEFMKAPFYQIEIYTDSNKRTFFEIENIKVYC